MIVTVVTKASNETDGRTPIVDGNHTIPQFMDGSDLTEELVCPRIIHLSQSEHPRRLVVFVWS